MLKKHCENSSFVIGFIQRETMTRKERREDQRSDPKRIKKRIEEKKERRREIYEKYRIL